ncbi:MAG: YihY/virulence factor BrkB family protein [Pararhodobacter sp.]
MSHGREATNPTQIPKSGWADIGLRVWHSFNRDRISLMAAGVAFYALLAIFPAIAATIAIAGVFMQPSMLISQLETMREVLPADAADILFNQAVKVAQADSGSLGLAAALSLAIALYSASRGTSSMIQGLNVAYDEEEKRGFVKLFGITLALTLGLIFGGIIAFSLTALIPVALAFLGDDSLAATLVNWIRWPVLALFAILGLGLFYRIGPSRRPASWRWLAPGAVLACVLWIIASLGFSFYVSNFGNYNETFGTLGGVVVLLLWFWISALIVLLGAEVDAEIEAQTRYDTTTGRGRPMGKRGAVKADTLGPLRGEE